MTLADRAAFDTVLACTLVAGFYAQQVRANKKDHRLFVSLVLFALNWAILLPYYALQGLIQSGNLLNFFPAYSGVLMLLAGAVLHREAVERNKCGEIGKYDDIALVCLGSLAGANLASSAFPEFVIALDPLLGFCGFASIGVGLGMLTGVYSDDQPWWRAFAINDKTPGIWRAFVVVAVVYFVTDFVWAVVQVVLSPSKMPWYFELAFAAYKALFSLIFFHLVYQQRTPLPAY